MEKACYARPRVIRGTQAKPLPLLPSGPGGVCSRPLHEARSLTSTHPNTAFLSTCVPQVSVPSSEDLLTTLCSCVSLELSQNPPSVLERVDARHILVSRLRNKAAIVPGPESVLRQTPRSAPGPTRSHSFSGSKMGFRIWPTLGGIGFIEQRPSRAINQLVIGSVVNQEEFPYRSAPAAVRAQPLLSRIGPPVVLSTGWSSGSVQCSKSSE